MSFRMPREGEDFAPNKLARMTRGEKRVTLDFDVYYAGAILGLCARERIEAEDYEEQIGRELTRTYPRTREEHSDTIAGMLIEAELARQSIKPDNANVILKIIGDYLSFTAPTRLTAEGHRLLDRYAAGGFRLMKERFISFDYEEEFLVGYLGLLDEVCRTSHQIAN